MATPEFVFKSAAYGVETFTVVDFQGTEAISNLYQFNIGLKCQVGTSVSLQTLLENGATLSLELGSASNNYSGVLAWVEQQQQAAGYNYYRVLLVPPVWKLSCNVTTAGFTGAAHPTVAIKVLGNAGITQAGKELSVTGITGSIAPIGSNQNDQSADQDTYPAYDFTCQYAETDLNFVCRLLENDGIYFYFEDNAGSCMMMLEDAMSYPPLPAMASIPFTDPSSTNNYECIVQLSRQLGMPPAEISVSGYNYQNTSVEVMGSASVSVDGQTSNAAYPVTWLFDNALQTPEAAQRLATVRAQEQACWADTYSGGGAVPGLRAGYTFQLTDHPVTAFNQGYLLTSVQHSARNLDQSWTTSTYTAAQTATTGAYYSNTFTAIPMGVQFRPQRQTPKPRISGLLSAMVYLQPDSSQGGTSQTSQGGQSSATTQVNPIPGYVNGGSTQDPNAYVMPAPPMDSQGRYLVTLPFANGAIPGSSSVSAWIRMAQPSTGLYTGAQFTLEPGAEVLLAFVNGNPDLPVIAGSVYNSGIPALLTAAQTDPQV